MCRVLLPLFLMCGIAGLVRAQGEPILQLQGQPYSGGSMTLHFSASVGAPAYVFYGLNPLESPLETNKGPFYVGSVANAAFIGTIPASGRIDVPFVMPLLHPSLAGIPLVLQGFVPGALTNPASVPLDQPYFSSTAALSMSSPEPQAGSDFGDRVAAGDLNGDGSIDLVVGAWFEDVQNLDKAGRAYIFWGPGYTEFLALQSPVPLAFGNYGAGIAVEDFNGDRIADLMIGEGGGFPLIPSGKGNLYIYFGGAQFQGTPAIVMQGTGVGVEADVYGRFRAIGDLNGDSLPDIAVGIPNADLGALSQAGRVEVYWAPTFASHAVLHSPNPGPHANFGSNLSIGDVTGDGLPDLIEGSGRDDVGGLTNVGSVHVFEGGSLAYLATLQFPLVPVAQASFGNELLTEDVDADGVAEIITMAEELDTVFVFFSLAPNDYITIHKPPTASGPLGAFGVHLGAADLNGDGLTDIAIGNMFEGSSLCSPGLGPGVVTVALAPYYSTFINILDVSPECSSLFAFDFEVVDLDLDGAPELLVGASVADDNGLTNSGHFSVIPSK